MSAEDFFSRAGLIVEFFFSGLVSIWNLMRDNWLLAVLLALFVVSFVVTVLLAIKSIK